MTIYNMQLNQQEAYVLLRAIATANDAEERDPEIATPEDQQVRNWLVERLLHLLPSKFLPKETSND